MVVSSDVSFCGASFPTDKQKWKVSILVSGRVMTPMAPSKANNDGCKLGRFNGGTCIEMGAGLISPKLVWWLYTTYSIYIYYTCDVYIYILYICDWYKYVYIYIYVYTWYINRMHTYVLYVFILPPCNGASLPLFKSNRLQYDMSQKESSNPTCSIISHT